jgi:hypothetical protein
LAGDASLEAFVDEEVSILDVADASLTTRISSMEVTHDADEASLNTRISTLDSEMVVMEDSLTTAVADAKKVRVMKKAISGTIAAGTAVELDSLYGDTGLTLYDYAASASTRAKALVFVNGQLMLLGDNTTNFDAAIDTVAAATNKVKFAFDLNADDLIQVRLEAI